MHSSYELTEGGGTKALRALILTTPEWASEFSRNAVADDAEVGGDPGKLAPVLRRKRARDLKKVHLLELCFRWGYKSDIWVQREGGVRRRAREREREAAAHAAMPRQQQLLSAAMLAPDKRRLPALVDGESVREFVDVTLAAFLTSSATLLEGPAARELALTRGVAFFQPVSLQEYRTMACQCRQIASAWQAAAVAQRAWAASLLAEAQQSDPDTACAAWQVLPLAPKAEPLELMLQQLKGILSAGERMRVTSYCRQDVGDHSAVVADEFKEAVHHGMAFLAAARLLRAQLASSGLSEYSAAADQLLQVLIAYVAATGDAYLRRMDWSSAAMSNGVRLVNMHSDMLAQVTKEFVTHLHHSAQVVTAEEDPAATRDVGWSGAAHTSSAMAPQRIVC